jgi:HEAT repeat protein
MTTNKCVDRQLRIADCGLRISRFATSVGTIWRLAITSLLGITLLIGTPARAGSVADIVAKMPAYDAATGQPLLEEILKLGPDALKELCSLVTPPQDTGDAKARYAIHGLALHTKRPGAEADRAKLEKALLDALGAAQDADLKQFFIEQLQLCGSEAAADAVAALLGDERLCDPAAQALIRIGTPRCVEFIRNELPKAQGKRLVTIVQALGVLADKPSAKAILPFAADKDQTLRRTAWFALANIGDASAVEALKAAAGSEGRYERALGTKYYLLLASRLAEGGQKDAAAVICHDLLTTRTDPAEGNVRCAALYVLQKASDRAGAEELLAALDGKNVYVREAAMTLLLGVKGESVTSKLIEKAGSATGAAKAALIMVLGLRGDKQAVPTVMAAMDDKDAAVSGAAIKAAALLAPGEIMKLLTARMKSTDPTVIAAAADVLAGLKAEGFGQALAAAMPDASPAGKAALLDLLAARGATGQSKVVFDALDDSDATVRKAAAKALAMVAVPADIERIMARMLAETDEGARAAIQNALVSLCRKGPGAKCVLDALAKADAGQKPLLLATLARIGGADALSAVMKDVGSADAATKDAATRALADWQGTEALEPLAALAHESIGHPENKVHRVLVLRGIARLIRQDTNYPAGKAAGVLCFALAAAETPAEKDLVFSVVGEIHSPETLSLARRYLQDADYREGAAAAIVKIACPSRGFKGLKGPEVVVAMKTVIEVSKNASVVEQAKKHLANIEKNK